MSKNCSRFSRETLRINRILAQKHELYIPVTNSLYHFLNKKSSELKGDKGKFWVVKQHPKLKKGDKIFCYKDTKGDGIKVREIIYLKDKNSQKILGNAAKILSHLNLPNQYGFVNGRNVVQTIAPHQNAKAVMLIDLQDAFNQISAKDVYYVFHNILRLNKKLAKLLTNLCTYRGYLFQGNPLSPMIFNIMAGRLYATLKGLSKHGVKANGYADDLEITSDNFQYFSWKYIRRLTSWIEDCGFTINKEKIELKSNNSHWFSLGLVVHENQLKIKGKRHFINKARYLQKAAERKFGDKWKKMRNPRGNINEVVINGLRNWANILQSSEIFVKKKVTLKEFWEKSYALQGIS